MTSKQESSRAHAQREERREKTTSLVKGEGCLIEEELHSKLTITCWPRRVECMRVSASCIRSLPPRSSERRLSISCWRPRRLSSINWLSTRSVGANRISLVTNVISPGCTIMMLSPCVSKPARPARPTICWYRARVSFICPI